MKIKYIKTVLLLLLSLMAGSSFAQSYQINVVSPTSGQQITKGTPITLRITSPDYLDLVTADLFRGSTQVMSFIDVYQSTDVQISSSNLQPGTNYRFRLYKDYDTSNATWSPYFTIKNIDAPIATAANPVGSDFFYLNWNSVSGATGYRIDISENSNFSTYYYQYQDYSVSGNSFFLQGLTPGGTFYYRVRAENSSSTSSNSNVITVLTKPGKPTGLYTSNVTTSSFRLNWPAVTGAANYRLDVATNSSFTNIVSGYNNLYVSGTNRTISGLQSGTRYYFRLRAQNTSGYSSYSDVGDVLLNLETPTLSPSTSVTATSFIINWNNVSGASAYELELSENSDFSTSVYPPGYIGDILENYYAFTEAAPGTIYYFKVRAKNGSLTSTYSTIGNILTLPAKPNVLTASNITQSSFKLNWSAVSSATHYTLDIATDAAFTNILPLYNNISVSGNERIVNLPSGDTYFCRVRAQNASGSSINSPTAMVVFAENWLLEPNGGESYVLGSSIQGLIDLSVFNSDILIDLYKGGVRVTEGPPLSPTGDGFDLALSTSLTPGSDYKIRIYNSTEDIEDWSDGFFSITGDENYIKTTHILIEGVTNEHQIDDLTVDEKSVQHMFYDGLGRPSQQVSWQISPLKKDMVLPITYDDYGRQNRSYLPVVIDQNHGWYKEGLLDTNGEYTAEAQFFYNDPGTSVAMDNHAYSETIFEPSPLNRPLKQGAPGLAWQPDADPSVTTDHVIHYGYQVNLETDNVYSWDIDFTTDDFETTGHYPNGQLYKNTTNDEEGHTVIEFVDKLGQTVLKRVQAHENGQAEQWADTYYVYDDFGNLRYVLPPEAIEELKPLATTFPYTPSPTLLACWAFQYNYDHRNRMTEKQVPGAKPVKMIYDDRDRLVLTQDGEQRLQNKWLFTKYDVLNRPIMTGEKQITTPEATLRDLLNGPDWLQNYEAYETLNGNTFGYTSNSLPKNLTTDEILTVTYYDDYTFPHASFYPFEPELGNTAPFDRVKAQVTGTKAKVLDGSNTWLESVSYYDDRYRVIQNQTQTFIGGIDRISNRYDFIGQVLETKTTHESNNSSTLTINTTFDYDHAGRLINTWHKVNDQDSILLVHNEYNELGELIEKNLHSEDQGTTYAQSIDYRYNIRGWLTNINNAQLASTANNEDTQQAQDYWGMELGYNSDLGLNLPTSHLQYNGNISAVKWSDNLGIGSATDIKERAYAYTYDPMNRIKTAHHSQYTSAWTTNNNFQLSGLSYDLNGNIETLTRRDEQGVDMDVLAYTYNGNQLLNVSDNGNDHEGFKDGANPGNDYIYDDNGNLKRDLNKDITSITYNHLNLPKRVEKDANNYLLYTYDAAGMKLRQEVYEAGVLTKTTDYIGAFIYENDEIALIQHEEGRIVPALPGLDPGSRNWEYQYKIADHLGNTRIMFTTDPKTITFTANYEGDPNNPDDASLFEDVQVAAIKDFNHTTGDPNYTNAQVLRSSPNSQIGSAIAISVGQGDKITAVAFAKYIAAAQDPNVSSATIASALVSAFTDVASSGLEGGTGTINDNFGSGSLIGGTGFPLESGTAPKAFLNLMFLPDGEAINLVKDASFAYDQIANGATEAVIDGVSNSPFDELRIDDFVAPSHGYVMVYVSNEGSLTDVYFDDIEITVEEHPVIQLADYYPFGLQHVGGFDRMTTVKNDYKFIGKERIDDLGLNWDDFGWRMYQPDLGRFFTQDRFAEKYYSVNPYQYAANDPTNLIDVNGDSIWFSVQRNEAGELTGVTMNVTGKVINGSDRDIDMSEAVNDISDGIEDSFNGSIKVNGEEVSFSTNVQLSEATSMDQVEESDHLIVLANASGKEGTARGAANMIGGKVMHVDANDFPTRGGVSGFFGMSDTRTTVHEMGHLAGLEHNNGFWNLMKQGASGDYLGNNQLQTTFNRSMNNSLNLGSNSAKHPITGERIPNPRLIYRGSSATTDQVGLKIRLDRLR